MSYRAQYIALAKPEWPPNPERMNRMYATIARAICGPVAAHKHALLHYIQGALTAFDGNCAAHMVSQATFDAWHTACIGQITGMPFNWTDSRGVAHATLSFGAAQKLLNLGFKDWWAVSPHGTAAGVPVDRLHGPLDQIVYSCTSRFCGALPVVS